MTQPLVRRQLALGFPVAWSATDAWSFVSDYDVRIRSAGYNEGFSAWADWDTGTDATSVEFLGQPGVTYCFDTRSRDGYNMVGPWSPQRCTSVPVDDRALNAGDKWKRWTGSDQFLSTYTGSRINGATLKLKQIHVKRLSLLVNRAPGAGKVQVSLSGTILGTFNLVASTVKKRQLIKVTDFSSVRAGTLTIRIVSPTGKPVQIDGVVISGA